MRKWMIVALTCVAVGATACGGGSSSNSNNGTTSDTGQQADGGTVADAGSDAATASDTGDAGSGQDATTADGGADTADAGQADSGTTYPNDVAFQTYREDVVKLQTKLFCQISWECQSPVVGDVGVGSRYASEQDCLDQMAQDPAIRAEFDQDTANYQRLIDAGRIIYDSENAAACLNFVAGLSQDQMCDPAVLFTTDGPCDQSKILQGTIGDGGSCINSHECAGDAYCNITGGSCSGTCTTRSSNCGGSTCADGEYCDYSQSPNVCETDKTEGAQCTSNRECGANTCMILDGDASGVCMAPRSRAIGESCTSYSLCEGTAQCVNQTCEAFSFVTEGHACDTEHTCEPGTLCLYASTDAVVGTCKPPAGVGDPCMYSDNCQAGLFCDGATSASLGSCARPKPSGADCHYAAECQSGLCVDSKCADTASQCPIPS